MFSSFLDTPVTLAARPGEYSLFTGWTGAGCSGPGVCTFSLTASTTVAANFAVDMNHSVQVDASPYYYSSLQTACDNVVAGATVRAWAIPFAGGLTLNGPVTLSGGYNAAYSVRPGYTTINGKLTIGKGRLVADRIELR